MQDVGDYLPYRRISFGQDAVELGRAGSSPRQFLGLVSIKEGAWFTPDGAGTDTTGCANALADDRSAPCGATTYNTNLVEVERGS